MMWDSGQSKKHPFLLTQNGQVLDSYSLPFIDRERTDISPGIAGFFQSNLFLKGNPER